jgi:hypothetical protein
MVRTGGGAIQRNSVLRSKEHHRRLLTAELTQKGVANHWSERSLLVVYLVGFDHRITEIIFPDHRVSYVWRASSAEPRSVTR